MKHDHSQSCEKEKLISEIQRDHLHLFDKSFPLMVLYLCA